MRNLLGKCDAVDGIWFGKWSVVRHVETFGAIDSKVLPSLIGFPEIQRSLYLHPF